ncbi:MAG: alkaline phosphatase [Planctomycetota bacterium]
MTRNRPIVTDPKQPGEATGGMTRREALGLGLAAGAAALGGGAARAATTVASDRTSEASARNVIMLVSDGMSTGTFTLARELRRRRGMGESHWCQAWAKPGVRRAMMTTHSANSVVTDSAAAGSAWAIGRKCNNGALNMTPDNIERTPIGVQGKSRGKAVGVATTTRVTHATPASWFASVPKRSMEDTIAAQMLERKADLILGGGRKHFPAELTSKHGDVTFVSTKDELGSVAGIEGRLVGLFNDDHLSYEVDRVYGPRPEEPSLADMTELALRRLDRHPNGFLLQVEGGRVDHGAHANDVAGTINDQIAFDEAVGVALRYVEHRDDTLVIVTTDHGNANPGLTLYYDEGERGLQQLDSIRHSFEWGMERIEEIGGMSGPNLARVVEEIAGVKLREKDREQLALAAAGEYTEGFDAATKLVCALGAVLANHTGVGFVSPNHTSDMVEVTAFGPGSESLAPVIDNTQLYDLMMGAAALA